MGFWDAFPAGRLLADVSLWSADLTRLGQEIARVDAHVDLYHIDVSDAHFIPGLLLFPDLLSAVRPLTRRPFNVHLMVDDPLPHIEDFANAGADMVTVHCENGSLVPRALRRLEELGLARGLALGLDAPLDLVAPHLEAIDLVLLMGTPLGVKGKGLSGGACGRVEHLRSMLRQRHLEDRVRIEADGGIRAATVPNLRKAGADLVVAGSLAFKSDDMAATMAWLRSL
jgi:ribulose-phosphate 3-epimerase